MRELSPEYCHFADPTHAGFPQKWVDSAIPYGQLKKCLKKVTTELDHLGLDRDTLAQLAAIQSSPGFHYDLDGEPDKANQLRPRLTVFVHLQDGVAVDATLSPATRAFLVKIASRKPGGSQTSLGSNSTGITASAGSVNSNVAASTSGSAGVKDDAEARGMVQKVEVPLVFDGQFFNILQTDVSNLDTLQEQEQRKMTQEITTIGNEITKVTRPSNGRKSKDDLARWREIFELYLDARGFFSTRESDHGARTSVQAVQQLQWFQEQVLKRKLVQKLKLPASREAFSRFLNMNALLLQNLKFQEINQLAVAKILKSEAPLPPSGLSVRSAR
jgi:E3 ubiquitin-protein ligase BAH